MATINKLNKTVVAGERTRATDFNAVSGKVDELVQQVNTNTATFPNKADVNHTHNYATPQQISSLQSQINGKANASHEHYIGDVDELEERLNSLDGQSVESLVGALKAKSAGATITLTTSDGKVFTANIAPIGLSSGVKNYHGGIMTDDATNRLFWSIYYRGSVDSVSDLPKLSSSPSAGSAWHVKSDHSMRIVLQDKLATAEPYYAWSITFRDTLVYSGRNCMSDVFNIAELASGLSYGEYSWARVVANSNGNYYLAACKSNGDFYLSNGNKLYYYIDNRNTDNYALHTISSNYISNIPRDSELITAVNTGLTKSYSDLYWYIIPGNVSYSDDGTVEGGGSTDSGGTSGGSTDSGGSSDSGGDSDAASGTITVDFDSCLYTDSLTVQNTTKGTSVTVNSSNTTATLAVSVGDTIKYSSVKSSTAAADTANNMLGSSSIGWGATTHVIVESDFSKSAYCWWG